VEDLRRAAEAVQRHHLADEDDVVTPSDVDGVVMA